MLSRNQVRAGLLNLLLVSEHICDSLRGVAIPAPTGLLAISEPIYQKPGFKALSF